MDVVCSWLSGLGISVEKNRLSAYRKAFQTLEARVKAGPVEETKPDLVLAEAANAFHEFGEIFFIWRGLRSIDDPILRQKLDKVVTGSVMLSDERPEKSEPRNTLFELVIAAYLSLCGIKIQFRDPDDIVARVLHTPVLIECKRIQNEGKFERRFHEAEGQVIRNLGNEAAPGSKGITAIDISKTQNPGGAYSRVESPEQVRPMLLRRANQFCHERIDLFREGVDESIFAGIVYLRIPWITGSNVMGALNSQFVQLIRLNKNVGRNTKLFEGLRLYLTRLDPGMTERNC